LTFVEWFLLHASLATRLLDWLLKLVEVEVRCTFN